MGINLNAKSEIGATKTIDFVVMVTAWFLLAVHFQSVQEPLTLLLLWSVLTTMISLMFLMAIGYFDHYIPKPEWTGLLSLALALPCSAFYSKWVLVVMTQTYLIRYREIFIASICVALVFEASQWIFFEVHRALGRRLTLITYVTPAELDLLRSQVQESGAASWIIIRPAKMADHEKVVLRGDELVVISRAGAHHLKSHPELLSAHLKGQHIVDMTQLLKEFFRRVNLRNSDAWTFLLGSSYQHFLNRLYFGLKMVFEPLLAFVLLILLSPLYAVLIFSLYVTSGRPIFYSQKRLGYRGREFFLLKFRTMPVSAEKSGPQWASVDDPRVTPLGRFLRKSRMDELPQVINVLKGQLSFVGPRPERPEFYEMLAEHIPLFSLRLLVRPGITGWAQVRQGYAASIAESRTKLEYDLYYIQHMSPGLDLEILLTTLAMAMRGNHGR